jgi:small-conductance mechanosensitive channel
VAYDQDLYKVHELLARIARDNPWSLDEPVPVILFSDFKESGIEVQLGLWFAKSDFMDLKNSIMKDIPSLFAAEGIRFAHPNRLVQIVEGSAATS